MKLSKRERFLIGLVLLALIWTAAFKFFIVPEYEKLAQTREMLWELQGEKERMDLYLEHFPDLEERLGEMEENCADDFFYHGIDDVFMDRNLQAMAVRAGVDILRMDMEGPLAMDLGEATQDTVPVDVGIVKAVVTMEVKSRDAESLMKFAEEVYQESRSIVVSYMDMETEHNAGEDGREEYGGMSGIVEVRYYYEETE